MDASLYAVLFGAVGEAPTPYPLYQIQKVADEFEGIFGIKFSKVHDKLMSVVFRLVIIDIFAFDDCCMKSTVTTRKRESPCVTLLRNTMVRKE